MTRPQLAPGVAIVAAPGAHPAVRTPDGEFLRINASPEGLARLLRRLDGAPDTADAARAAGATDTMDAVAADAADEEADRLLAAFRDAGYLSAPAPWPPARAEVLVLGDPRLTEPLTRHLAAAGARPRATAPEEVAALAEGAAAPPAAVAWCLDRPVPPGLWDAADRLPSRGIAWARCHREGPQAWIEPVAAREGDVLAAHVRARRLAATPAHRELAAYWEGPAASGPHPQPFPAGAAVVAALLAAGLAAWAQDRPAAPVPGGADPLPAARKLRRVDLRDLTVTEHPVLPVPAVAPLPSPAP
ncbi:hypothetical protein GCM10027168_49400 [Streptomyces capparidis]